MNAPKAWVLAATVLAVVAGGRLHGGASGERALGAAPPGVRPAHLSQSRATSERPQPGTRPVTQARIDSPAVRASAGIDKLLPSAADRIYRELEKRFRPERAMGTVVFMDRFWRVSGNPGYAASLEHIKAGLLEAGFRDDKPGIEGASTWFEEYPNGGNGWELVRAEMTVVKASRGKVPEPVFDPVMDYIALCMNSFSTPPGGVTARLVYVGAGTVAASYEGLDVRGAVVLGDGGLRSLWQEAVRSRGAIGIISAAPPPPYTKPEQSPEVFQWGSVPYDEKSRAFGFKASASVARRLKERLREGEVTVKAEVETRFNPSPGRFLVAEIPGAVRAAERVVMVAHVQEPGANDNGSGCATLLEAARSINAAVTSRAITPPGRTLTFVWGDEMRASREWLRADGARARSTRAMFSLDMTGEDISKTDGTFIIEKEPDPSAVWPRPSDPHTEGGGGGAYNGATLKGSLLNDLLLAVCLRRARDTGWVVQANPYEGGSDHSIFLNAGVPAVLASHFTDRYYHTNLDRPDKVSPSEMANVGISVGTTAVLLSSAAETEALAVVDLVADAARRRLELESRQSAEFIGAAADRAAATAGERVLHDAWREWYTSALESVLALPATGAGEGLHRRVKSAIAALGEHAGRTIPDAR